MNWKHLILLVLLASTVASQAETPAEHTARLAWWREARFGLFVHWGPVSLTGQEISWSRANSNTNCPNNGPTPADVYDHLYERFNPTNFDAREWARIARSAGMKYVVLTAKHGDGFLLWNSQVDGYNISATPFRRDVCAELARAVRHENLKIGWYFSEMDWRDPDCRSTNNDRFNRKYQAELRELLANYGKISVLWFDTDGRPAMWDPTTTYALVRGLQPQILINNRLQMGSFEEWGHQGRLLTNEDFFTPEQRIGVYNDTTPWETCMTIGTQWAWKPDDQLKSSAEVIHILAQCVGGDGNLLLDVGPMPDGRIEPRQVDVLRQVGEWLKPNGESIYGTRGGPWKPTKAIASTRKGNVVYLHVLHWDGGAVELPALPPLIKSASLLNGRPVQWSQRDGTLTISAPPEARDPNDTVVKLKLAGSAMDIPAVALPPQYEATASNVYQNDQAGFGPAFAFDQNDQTRWATDEGTKQAWIVVKYKQPRVVNQVRISEAFPNRVQRFELQYRLGDDWRTLLTGTTLGADFTQSFALVTAREFRLNILDASEGPTINEIELRQK
jgi:alpha-L-fucosidase